MFAAVAAASPGSYTFTRTICAKPPKIATTR